MLDEEAPTQNPDPTEEPGKIEAPPPSPGSKPRKPRTIETGPEIASLTSEPSELAPRGLFGGNDSVASSLDD